MGTKYRNVIGQILFAVGLTLLLGGILSFYASNVELHFLNHQIAHADERMIWIAVNLLIAILGYFLWRNSTRKS